MSEHFHGGEYMDKPQIEAIKVTDGLGFGEGNISGVEGDTEDLQLMDQIITSPDILIPIDIDDETGAKIEDDGCGDGRDVGMVLKLGQTLKRSLNRAKVFGGGLAMTAATRIGLGKAQGQTFEQNFDEATHDADAAGVDYGAHTGPSNSPEDSGCGAIDEHPRALENTVIYKSQIKDTLAVLGVEYEGSDTDFEDIIANNAAIVEANHNTEYSGSKIMSIIERAGKVVKQLVHGHTERRIVLNAVEGYTVNQRLIRDATGERAQVFATDIWRLREIATKLGASPAEQNKAFMAQVIYTLGVAATLTKGDLPVYVINHARVPAAA
jgi:hypothetical protein